MEMEGNSVHPVVRDDDCDDIDGVVVIVAMVVKEEGCCSHLVCLLPVWLVVFLIGI